MPSNADTSNEARIRRLKGRTIANNNRLNPQPKRTQQSFTDGSLQNSLREGRMPYYQQTDTQTRSEVQTCCSCIPPGTPQNFIETGEDYNIGGYAFIFFVTWTPEANVIYTLTTDKVEQSIAITGPGAATVSVNTEVSDVIITLTATNSCGSASTQLTTSACFPAGTKIHLANGDVKNIEDVQVGDLVIGAFGEHNAVLALQHVVVGHSKMYRYNDEHITTDHHPHVSLDGQFYTTDIKTIETSVYGTNMLVINGEGKVESRRLQGLRKGRVQKLALGLNLKTIDGHRTLTKMEEIPMDFNTKLYNLVTGGSHTYHADGYAVTGWPSEEDFNYDTWTAT